MEYVNAIIQQILNAPDPMAEFQKIVRSSPQLQNAMQLAQQYGNGNFETAFYNMAAAQGKQAIGQQILQRMGLA